VRFQQAALVALPHRQLVPSCLCHPRRRNRCDCDAGSAGRRRLESDGGRELGSRRLGPKLFRACLSRSQTLAQPDTFSHRYPTPAQIREWVKDPVAYRYEYSDGVKATMLMMNGLLGDFTFAARLKGESEPLSTLFYLPPTPNVTYSASLMSKAEETFLTGKSPYPIERTLLTTGLVEAGVRSLGTGQKRIETPHLVVRYQAPRESTFARS
jgi:hypothetical protein